MTEKPQNLYQKIFSAHLLEGDLAPGHEMGITINQTLTQDATGTVASLQFEALQVDRVQTELSERVAPTVVSAAKGTDLAVAPNVDFYSGFVYDCLGIPREVYTPLFAMARISGWCAHRLEELISSRKIIRPAYKNVVGTVRYRSLADRGEEEAASGGH